MVWRQAAEEGQAMIPTPRPGPRFGDCPDCGRQHEGECHLAEMERNREVPAGCWIMLPDVRWRKATAEQVALYHGMPLWAAERMVAERDAGSIREAAEDDGC